MPRRSDQETGEVWLLLDSWADEQRRIHGSRPTQTEMAEMFFVSTSRLTNWKLKQSAMKARDMRWVSIRTGIPLELLADAVASDHPGKDVERLARDAAAIDEKVLRANKGA